MLRRGAGSTAASGDDAPDDEHLPLSPAEGHEIFARLPDLPQMAIAVSGGPDSLALLLLAHEWAARAPTPPSLIALTVDHGLRAGSRAEAEDVAALCTRLGVPHRILDWTGPKPITGVPEAARIARYALLRQAALEADAGILMTAHTRDDQAETFLMALARGSGVRGLAAMPPQRDLGGVILARPLLDIAKSRLVATVKAHGVPFVRDPTNEDPRFTRARLRAARAALDALGLDADRLASTARAMARADAALDAAEQALLASSCEMKFSGLACMVAVDAVLDAPEEIGLRVLSRLIRWMGGGEHGPRLERLERLMAELQVAVAAPAKLRRTLGGTQIVLEPRAGDGPRLLWLAAESGRGGLGVLRLEPGTSGVWGGHVEVRCAPSLQDPCEIREIGPSGSAVLRRHATATPKEILNVLPGVFIGGQLVDVPPVGWALAGMSGVTMAPVATPGRPADLLAASGEALRTN